MTEEEKAELMAVLASAAEAAAAQTDVIKDLWDVIKQMRETLDLHHSLIELLQQICSTGNATMSAEWQAKVSELEVVDTRLKEQFEAMQEMFALRHMTGRQVAEKLSVIKGGKAPPDRTVPPPPPALIKKSALNQSA